MRLPRPRLGQLTAARALLLAAAAGGALLAGTVSLPAMRADLARAAGVRQQADQVRQQVLDAEAVHTNPGTAASLRRLRAAIPAQSGAETALLSVQDAVRASGAQWVSSTPVELPPATVSGPGGARAVSTYEVSVVVRGTRGQVARLLSRVAHAPRLEAIDSVVLEGAGSLEATISVRLYALSPQR